MTINSFSNYLEQTGFFYEYGVTKSLLIIFFYASTALFISRKNIKKLWMVPERISLIVVALIAACFAYYYLNLIGLADLTYFYPSTTGRRIDNILILSILFGVTSSIYFYLHNIIFGAPKKCLTTLCTICLITSPLQLWSLYSSSTRDYLRAAILTIIFILIAAIIKGKIKFNFIAIYTIAAVMAICLTFRQEIWLYFVLLLGAILIFGEDSLKTRFLIAIKIVLIIVPAVLYLTSSQQQVDSALGRLIPGLSEDVVRLYFREPGVYIGPFADLTAVLFLNSNLNTISALGVWSASQEAILLLVDYLLRLPQLLLRIIELPLSTSMYPLFFSSTILGSALETLRSILSQPHIYFLSIISLVWCYRKNYRFLIYGILASTYIAFICSLQFFTKNIFHLELFSYIFLASLINYIFSLISFFYKKWNIKVMSKYTEIKRT